MLLCIGERLSKGVVPGNRESGQRCGVTTKVVVDAEALIRIGQLADLAKEGKVLLGVLCTSEKRVIR